MDLNFIKSLISERALFVINHSGGKDSQAMYIKMRNIIPAEQLIVIHAHLPEVEWPGTIEHIKSTVKHKLFIVQAKKTFFEMIYHRMKFPSPQQRQCTSDLKRGPINKQIRNYCNDNGFKMVVNCMGMRADESTSRAKLKEFKWNKVESNSKRDWYEYLPIHSTTEQQVFAIIKLAGETPHWVYAAGMSRCSCCICIMANADDLRTASKLAPDLFQKYIQAEEDFNYTMRMDKVPLKEYNDAA